MNSIFDLRTWRENCQRLMKKLMPQFLLASRESIFMLVLSLEFSEIFFSYLFSVTISSVSPDSRRIQLKNSALKTALNARVIDDLACKKQKKFHNLDDIEGKLYFLDRNYWSFLRQQETLIICSSIKSPYPQINLSLLIKDDFAVHVFYRDMEMRTIEDYKIPKYVMGQNTLEILIENMKKIDAEKHQTKPQNMIKISNVISTIDTRRIKLTF